MQEKEQKISPVKQRILQFAASLGVSKRDFYKKTGISRGTLESNTGITEDVVAKFIATFPEVNIVWLWTGEGSMTPATSESKEAIELDTPTVQEKEQKSDVIVEKLIDTIREQAETIGSLKGEIKELKRHLEKNASAASIDSTAHAAG